ncbi:MAG: hypothetical protein Q8J74_05045 [Candidatus Didemnitutus sp.]|nr:hypothetical protein [Candidatus Didemnitutus sp.]
MPSRQEIAATLFARCLEHEHKPGKVQFTKYLYLVDYCHWRLKGRKATDIEWLFHHYGPWSPAAEECMADLSSTLGFSWREEEEPVLQYVRVEEPGSLGLTLEGIIKRIVTFFKDHEPMVVVEFAYSQTEPMLNAKRGDILDFKVVPVDQSLPEFAPAKVKPPQFALATGIQEKMVAMQAKAGKLRQQALERQRFRETPDYRTALQMLAVESHSAEPVPALRGHMSRSVLEDLGASPA